MTLTVTIPMPLRNLTGDQEYIEVQGKTVDQILEELETRFPGFQAKISDGNRKLGRFVTIFVNGEDIRFLEGLSTPVSDGSEVSIILAVSGG